ncbi:MAG: TonB-dependent receptor [Candidatus Pseudobacter hemicellulosilyticus]|uniref:TonB-dependent receptor n=1 Tax=Candidatus Pseudobacter hemicellulosilyticus TaxID=3121375 RepID=A0AAJ5WY79_9BACT|nr:MAG: TonB-dependent receptor [Pseudobacter sp.]
MKKKPNDCAPKRSSQAPLALRLVALLCFLLCSRLLPAQTSPLVRGTVSDEEGNKLQGVSVFVKSTGRGVATNEEGVFSVPVNNPEQDTLVFTYTGYLTKEVPVKGKTLLNQVLTKSGTSMDEVIVVGYGTQKKGDVTASISTIKSGDISRSTAVNTASALVGKVSGISNRTSQGTPGSTTNLQIRNLGTPLYVIDGVIKDESQFNNLDMHDIESISVVKDGAAAIYGVKAANGVILVKTKRGATGKATINFNSYTGWQTWTRFPELASAYDWVRATYEGQVNSGVYTGNPDETRAELEKWRTGYYDPATGEDYRGYDWSQYARKNVPQNYVSMNASGGSDKVNYYVSLSGISQDAVFKDFKYERRNFQGNMDAKITKRLTFGMSLNGRIETRDNPGLVGDDDYYGARYGLYRNPPTYRPYANDNELYPNRLPDPATNHALMSKDISGFYDEKWRVLQGNWDVRYETPIPGLTAKMLYSYYYANKRRDNFEKSWQAYTYNPATDNYDITYTKPDSWLQKDNENVEENLYQFSLNYDRTFNKVHKVSAVAVSEFFERKSNRLRIGQSPAVSNFIPVIYYTEKTIQYLDDWAAEYATIGFSGRLRYDYASRYYIGFSGRYDGSWKFPTNKRWGFFPSVEAGWRISGEEFFKNSPLYDIFNEVKLRASYGEMGDDNIAGYADYAYVGGYTFNQGAAVINPNSGAVIGSQSRGIPITNVTWITSKMMNIGLDFGLLNNKLTASVDGFYRKREGMPGVRTEALLPLEAGFNAPMETLPNTDMHIGIDGMITWRDKIGAVNYTAGVNATFARHRIGDRYGEIYFNSWDKYRWATQDRWANVYGGANTWAAEVIGRFTSQEQIDNYPVIHDEQGNRTVLPGDFIYKDINGDGRIDGYDERPLGYGEGLPYFTFGINLGAEWKGFDIAADFAGATMQTIVLDLEAKWPFQNGGNSPAYILNDRWHRADVLDPNSEWIEGRWPAIRTVDIWGSGGSYRRWNSFFMNNTRYLRLKNLQVGYTIPRVLTNRINIERVRFYFLGTNLFSFDNMRSRGLDPEQGSRAGFDYPQHRIITLGLQVTL